jgi:hypothetical protein
MKRKYEAPKLELSDINLIQINADCGTPFCDGATSAM